jgi:E3 ubiquitin-protein ligase HUWE1
MHRMMQSSGTAEGLRGLIDSSLLKSIKKIIEHRSLFGPNVLPIGVFLALLVCCSPTELLLAINILATFVHNEPTSLTVIQEAGVPEAFYRAVEAGLEPVIEVCERCISFSGKHDACPGNPSHSQCDWRLMS